MAAYWRDGNSPKDEKVPKDEKAVPEIQFPPACLRELVVGDKKFRSSCDFQLTQADLQEERTELKEADEGGKAALQKLRDMLIKDKDFTFRTDDAYLLRFLRYRKFNHKEAYNSLRKFYGIRNEYPELFHRSSIRKSLLDTKLYNLLPYTDEEGHPLFILKFGNWNPDELSIPDLLHLYTLVSDITSMNPHMQINGFIGIWDFAGIGLPHMSEAGRPNILRLWTKMAQELYPWRISRVILFNCNALLHAGFATVRMLLKKKIADRIIPLRSDLSQLHEYVNPCLLPKEYGGSLENEECYSFTSKAVLGNSRYLEYEFSFITPKNL